MSKFMSIALLIGSMAICGCESMKKDKDKDMDSSAPKKMSVDAKKCDANNKACCEKK